MKETAQISPERDRNNFGFLRLLFAIIVILSHSPELIDGNRSREILTRVFGTKSLGELAVDGFFLISGYLITKSFINRKSLFDYLQRRVLRIYPGYLVAYIICFLVVLPLSGGSMIVDEIQNSGKILFRALLLLPPHSVTAFSGLAYPETDGALWTIAYEFRCYMLIAILGLFGLLSRRWLFLAATGILSAQTMVSWWINIPYAVSQITGELQTDLSLFSMFAAGSCFYLFREEIKYRGSWALFAFGLFSLSLCYWRTTSIGTSLFGGYCLFWYALHAKANSLSRFDNRYDISYGTYLYAWPVQNLIIWYFHPSSFWLLFFLAAPVSCVLGFISWCVIEKRFVRRTRRTS